MKNNIKKIALLGMLIGLQQAHGNILDSLGLEEEVTVAKAAPKRFSSRTTPAPQASISAKTDAVTKLPPVQVLQKQKDVLLAKLEQVQSRTLNRIYQGSMKATGSSAQQFALDQDIKGLNLLIKLEKATYGQLDAFLTSIDA